MIVPEVGDTVTLRDGRRVLVSDVSDQGENGMVSTGPYPGTGLMPAETIFVGNQVIAGNVIVSDFSEIVSIDS